MESLLKEKHYFFWQLRKHYYYFTLTFDIQKVNDHEGLYTYVVTILFNENSMLLFNIQKINVQNAL